MKIIDEIIRRRVIQFLGSYLFAGTSFVLFMDWFVRKYNLPEYYPTITLICIVAILPSLLLIAYTHGAPGKDEWTKLDKIGVPINLIFLIGILIFGYRTNWFSDEPSKDYFKIFYIDFTSSPNYIHHYYTDFGYGSYHYFKKDKYIVESISDSLLSEIRSLVFADISSSFANQDVAIDMSFPDDEQNILNQWIYPKVSELSEDDKVKFKSHIAEFGDILGKRLDYYSSDGLPDLLHRVFIYKITEIETMNTFIIIDYGTSWEPAFSLSLPAIQWGAPPVKYDTSSVGINKLITAAHENIYSKIHKHRYGGTTVGKVIGKLDGDLVKIKQYKLGLIKKKVRLQSNRLYKWALGGAEMRIEDLNQYINYLKNTDQKIIWKVFKPQIPYNKQSADSLINYGLNPLYDEIFKIENKLRNNGYGEQVSSNQSDMSYTMEVIEVIDSIAIARIIDSELPVYKVRIGDFVHIQK